MSQVFRRRVTQQTLSENVPKTIGLPRNYAIRDVICKLAGSITISGGTISGTVKDSNPLQFIRRVEIRRSGQDTPINIPPEFLHRINQIFFGTRPDISGLANGDAQSNIAVRGSFIIPFQTLRGISPIDTLLKAGGLSSLDLFVDIAQASDLVEGGDRTIAVGSTAFTLVVESLEEIGLENWIFGDMKLYSVAEPEVTASSDNFQIKPIPVGNEYYALVLIARAGNILNNSIINRITLASGSEKFYADIDADALRYDNKRQFGIESFPDGYYVLPLSIDGMLNSCLDVRQGTGRNTLEIELKVTKQSGTNKISIYAMEYIRPKVLPVNNVKK